MKKLLRRMMVIGCLVVTCMSVTGCWVGDLNTDEVTGTEDEKLSFDAGYKYGKKTANTSSSDEDIFEDLDKNLTEHPERLYYDLYIKGYVRACTDNNRPFMIEGKEQDSSTYYAYLLFKYQMRSDSADDESKHMAAAQVIRLTLQNKVPECGIANCLFDHQKGNLFVCNLYDENNKMIGKGYYDTKTYKVSYEMNNK